MEKALDIIHCVQEYSPNVGGMAEVVRQLSERLVKLGHRVTVYTSYNPLRLEQEMNGVVVRSYAIEGNSVQGISGESSKYISDVQTAKADIVTIFASQHWAADLLLPILNTIKAKKVFVPTGFSALHNTSYSRYFESMSSWLHHFDMNVFLSNFYQDIEFAKKYGVKNFIVIPNGAAEEDFNSDIKFDLRKKLGLRKEKIILHVGSYTGIKGHVESLKIFLKAKSDDAVLLMIGSKNSYLKRALWRSPKLIPLAVKLWLSGKKYIIDEWTRDQTVDAFKQADLFLFPSKVECSPIVLFECMAAGLPFLSTPAGNAEELVDWSEGAGVILPAVVSEQFLVEVDIEASALILSKVINDTQWLESASKNGHNQWQKKFTWQKIAKQYEELYEKLVYHN